jgi:hypothetical protein
LIAVVGGGTNDPDVIMSGVRGSQVGSGPFDVMQESIAENCPELAAVPVGVVDLESASRE